MTIDGRQLRFVLSAGRTGTAFLREFLKTHRSAVQLAYEPPTSRRCWMLWNMAQAGLVPGGLSTAIACRRRAREAAAIPAGAIRLEINSFLSPFVGDLARHVVPFHVVHMVRHPFTWIPSMGNFKAAYWRRHVIDYVPFTRAVHPLARRGWSRLDEIERLAWRWRLANEGLAAADGCAADYRLVRYEDLLSTDHDLRAATLTRLLEVAAPDLAGRVDLPVRSPLVNARPPGNVPDWPQWDAGIRCRVEDICGELATRFGYGARPP